MTHPDHVGTLDELEKLQAVEPVYPLTAGVTLKTLAKAIEQAQETAPEMGREWVDEALLRETEVAALARGVAGRASPGIRGRAGPPGAGAGPASPMTNCWPTNSLSLWCA